MHPSLLRLSGRSAWASFCSAGGAGRLAALNSALLCVSPTCVSERGQPLAAARLPLLLQLNCANAEQLFATLNLLPLIPSCSEFVEPLAVAHFNVEGTIEVGCCCCASKQPHYCSRTSLAVDHSGTGSACAPAAVRLAAPRLCMAPLPLAACRLPLALALAPPPN